MGEVHTVLLSMSGVHEKLTVLNCEINFYNAGVSRFYIE